MSDDPFHFDPVRTEPRGEFPKHEERPHPPYTQREALKRALDRWYEWKRNHGD